MAKFWKRMALGFIVVVVLTIVSGVYAYWKGSMLPANTPVSASVTSYPLELRMELAKTEYQQGELINPIVYLKNISNRTIELYSYKGILDFKITDENETVIYYQYMKVFFQYVPFHRILKPEEEFVDTLQKTVVEDENNNLIPVRILKGTYKIIEYTPQIIVAYFEPYERIGELSLHTPPMTIRIT